MTKTMKWPCYTCKKNYAKSYLNEHCKKEHGRPHPPFPEPYPKSQRVYPDGIRVISKTKHTVKEWAELRKNWHHDITCKAVDRLLAWSSSPGTPKKSPKRALPKKDSRSGRKSSKALPTPTKISEFSPVVDHIQKIFKGPDGRQKVLEGLKRAKKSVPRFSHLCGEASSRPPTAIESVS